MKLNISIRIATPMRDTKESLQQEYQDLMGKYYDLMAQNRKNYTEDGWENEKATWGQAEALRDQLYALEEETKEKALKIMSDCGIPESAAEELKRYNATAGKILKREVIEYFSQFKRIPNKLYRGLGFDAVEGQKFLDKLKIKTAQEGAQGSYGSKKVQSWTSDPQISEEFAGKFVFGGIRDSESLGIILEATIDPSDVMIDLEHIPEPILDTYVKHHQKEYLVTGVHSVKIHKLIGNWASGDSADAAKRIPRIVKELSLKLQKLMNGVVTKTWNKAPGFGIDWGPEIIFDRRRMIENSFEVSIDGFEVTFEPFRGFKKEDKGRNKIFTGTSYQDLAGYLENEAFEVVEGLLRKSGVL